MVGQIFTSEFTCKMHAYTSNIFRVPPHRALLRKPATGMPRQLRVGVSITCAEN
uniref:Uncharacterized protein n=1 Tax=Arundo donax TaxID=35708 RepID=A0A0A9HXN9_ARUDO